MTKLGVGIQGDNIGEQLAAFEALIGQPVKATRHYRMWSEPLVDADVQASIAAGKSPLISLHPFDPQNVAVRWADIVDGIYDDVLNAKADELIALGDVKVRFVWHHEPEDDVDSINSQGACGTTPDEFVASWLHVRRLFRERGVRRNVKFGLCLMGATYRGTHGGPDLWCPATLPLDFIATDGYNRGAWGSPPGWHSFNDVYDAAHTFISGRGKPMVIEECGCAEGEPGQKAAWFAEAAETIKGWGDVSLFMYSNIHSTHFGYDAFIDTTPESLAAFQDLTRRLA